MNEKIVLIGAGSAMFTRGLVADILRQGWDGEIALVDIDPVALDVAERMSRKMISAKGSSLKLSASTDKRKMLPDATVVICTIGVGGRRAWELDVKIPRQFGIYQPVGDSVMPGGTSRALRMIPPMVGIARDVMRLAPKALFFNYGNPMSAVCRGVRKATGADMTGLCHGVIHVAGYLAGLLGIPPRRLTYTAVGMNHLTWFTDVRAGNKDAMPLLLKLARQRMPRGVKHGRLGRHFAEAGTAARGKALDTDNPFTWELVHLFHAFPAVLDRHVTEFFPHIFCKEHSYYGKTPGVDAYSFEGTIQYGEKIFDEMKKVAMSPRPLPSDYFDKLSGEHEQVTDIIESIRKNSGRVFSANLPNRGQVPNLPLDAVIECPARADRKGVHSIQQKPMAPGLVGTLATRFQWVETVVDAALEGDRRKFVQALLLDGAVTSVDAAWKLADELLAAHSAYLPQFRKTGRKS